MCRCNNPRTEYVEYVDRSHWYRCLNCGEAWPEYQENDGC